VALVVCGGNISANELVKKRVYKINALATIGVALLIFGFVAMISIANYSQLFANMPKLENFSLIFAVVFLIQVLLIGLIYVSRSFSTTKANSVF